MTHDDSNLAAELDVLSGWTLRGWSLLPQLHLTLTLVNFGAYPDSSAKKFAQVFCSGVSGVVFEGIEAGIGEEVEIERVAVVSLEDLTCRFEFITSRGGRISGIGRSIAIQFI